jgi:hypothetical protein
MWFNDGVTTVKRAILEVATSDSTLGGEIGGGITLVNKLHERHVLEALHFLPNRAWNRQGEEALDVLAQPVWFLKETRSHRVVRAVQMEDYENDENFLLGGHLRLYEVSTGVEDAREFRLGIHSFPQIAMLLGQLNKIRNAASAGFKQKCDADQKEACSDSAGLSESKPIVAHPIRKGHASIISSLPPASSP